MTERSADQRTPALAHLRFKAARETLTCLSLAQRFERIAATNLWGAETSTSGVGSELDATAAVREALPSLIAQLGIRSLLDAPCGDASWITRLSLAVDYFGLDIVPSLIAANTARYASRSRTFLVADLTRDDLPHVDAILCRDCLVHLSFSNIQRALVRFRASGATWLIATSFAELGKNDDCEDGDWRPLNFRQPPFRWTPPNFWIDERCTEGNGSWADKGLGVWRLADLP